MWAMLVTMQLDIQNMRIWHFAVTDVPTPTGVVASVVAVTKYSVNTWLYLWLHITLRTLATRLLRYAITIAAYVLVSNQQQAINNHNVDPTLPDILSRNNHQTNNVRDR